jgi:predicted PurR-regulated permease PerM
MSFPSPTAGQARIIWAAVTGVALAVIVALIVGCVWGMGRILQLMGPVLWPLAVAGVLAYLLDPLVDYIEHKGVSRTRAILSVFALAVVLLVGLVGSVLPQLITETRQLAQRVPDYAHNLQLRIEGWVNNPPELVRRFLGSTPPPPPVPAPDMFAPNNLLLTNAAVPPVVVTTNVQVIAVPPVDSTNGFSLFGQPLDKKAVQSATGWLARILPQVGNWFFGQVTRVASWIGVIAGLALVPIYAFYFLLEKQGIQSRWTEYLPVTRSDFRDELIFVIKSINDYLIVFFRSQLLVAICDGVMYAVGFLIIGLPYAILLGVLAIFLTMVPFLGAIITCAFALVLAFVQFGDWQHPAYVLIVFAVVQALEGFVVQPKIMGDRVGLHPLTIIIAVITGTTLLGGILGGILAIPLTAALRVLMFRYVWKKRPRVKEAK